MHGVLHKKEQKDSKTLELLVGRYLRYIRIQIGGQELPGGIMVNRFLIRLNNGLQ